MPQTGQVEEQSEVSFGDILQEFESHKPRPQAPSASAAKAKGKPANTRRGTVVGVSGDFLLIDYGVKSEGVIASADLLDAAGELTVKRGDTFEVAITGRNSEGLV